MSRPVPVTVEAVARATPAAAFDAIVPIELFGLAVAEAEAAGVPASP